jgi:serine/threonine-protein kinase
MDAAPAPTATETVTAQPRTITAAAPTQIPSVTVPADATPCASSFSDAEFETSAIGTSVTSCPFAEAVRYQYLRRGVRNAPIVLDVISPVTHKSYSMACSGGQVVRCFGGNDAVVYLY